MRLTRTPTVPLPAAHWLINKVLTESETLKFNTQKFCKAASELNPVPACFEGGLDQRGKELQDTLEELQMDLRKKADKLFPPELVPTLEKLVASMEFLNTALAWWAWRLGNVKLLQDVGSFFCTELSVHEAVVQYRNTVCKVMGHRMECHRQAVVFAMTFVKYCYVPMFVRVGIENLDKKPIIDAGLAIENEGLALNRCEAPAKGTNAMKRSVTKMTKRGRESSDKCLAVHLAMLQTLGIPVRQADGIRFFMS